jgi:hypothetical protein
LRATISSGNITNISASDASAKRISIQTSKGEFTILCQ